MECKSVRWQHHDPHNGSDVWIQLVFRGNHDGMGRNIVCRKNMDNCQEFFKMVCIARKCYNEAKGKKNESMNKLTKADFIIYLEAIKIKQHKTPRSTLSTSNRSLSKMQYDPSPGPAEKNEELMKQSKNSWKQWIKENRNQKPMAEEHDDPEKSKNDGAHTAKKWWCTAATIAFPYRQIKRKGLNSTSIILITKASKWVVWGNDEIKGQTTRVHTIGTQYRVK